MEQCNTDNNNNLYNYCITGGSDYVQLSTTLSFTPSSAVEPQCRNVTINLDDILEVDESFLVELSSTDRAVNSLPVQSTVNIEDSTGILL